MDDTDQEFEDSQALDTSSFEQNVVEVHQGEIHIPHSMLPKYMEVDQTIAYRKLVVPQSMRSVYWKFFGFPADDSGDILTRIKIVCLLCKTQIAYNRNTSNLRMHLQNKHGKELKNLEFHKVPKEKSAENTKEKKAQKKMLKNAMANSKQHIFTTDTNGTVVIKSDHPYGPHTYSVNGNQQEPSETTKPLQVIVNELPSDSSTPNISFIIPNNITQNVTTKPVSEAMLEFLIIDLQLPEVVQYQGFQRLLATLKSPCQIPDRCTLETKLIPEKYSSFKETIMSNISSLQSEVSLAIEEWMSKNGERFFTFLVYYQMPGQTSLESKVLLTVHGPECWSEKEWDLVLDSLLSEWGIEIKRVTAVVLSTDRVELQNALTNKGLNIVPCLLHALQECALACFSDYEIACVLNKCRTIIGSLIMQPQLASSYFEQEQLLRLEENALTMDYPSVWTTTYNMLHQILVRKDILISHFNCNSNVEQNLVLDEDQWQIVADLVEILEPFTVTITTLSEENIPLMSLLKPLLWRLTSSHLSVNEDDSSTAKTLKESLARMLFEKYADSKVNMILQLATFLDPRFKEVPYAAEDDKRKVNSPVKQMLVELIQERGDATVIDESKSPAKKSRLSGMEFLLGGVQVNKKSMSATNKAELELSQYQSEPSASLDNCPIQWWNKQSIKCPNLGVIANRYNCVPVCCSPPSRISSEHQTSYYMKRAALPIHLVDKMLFLHGNYNLR